MLSFKIDAKYIPLSPIRYRIPQLDKLKTELSAVKNHLDEHCDDKKFMKYWYECDPFKLEKDIIGMIANTQCVSNAWLKCYEIMNYFKLLPTSVDDKFVHFDNAAFPGSFILSTHHTIATTKDWINKYQWRASSLISDNSDTKDHTQPLGDTYKLQKNYPDNWLMDDSHNGDVRNKSNIMHFHKSVNADLYTSDLGFDFSCNYNNQEISHLPANIGQILSGLLTLKQGGNFVIKQYTFFEPITLSIIYCTATFFDEFYVCKPYTSKMANSEIYLVGKGFNSADLNNTYIKTLFEKLEGGLDVPLFDASNYREYIKKMVGIARLFNQRQSNKILEDIRQVEDLLKSSVIKNYLQDEDQIHEWYNNNEILPIEDTQKLKILI
jgi:hypothetical protein